MWLNPYYAGLLLKGLQSGNFSILKARRSVLLLRSLDHLEKDCRNILPDGKHYYGPWLRANGQHPTLLINIKAELDRLNSGLLNSHSDQSPKTPTDRGITPSNNRIVSPVSFSNLSGSPSFTATNKAGTSMTPKSPPGFQKPQWDILISKMGSDKVSPTISNHTVQHNVKTPTEAGKEGQSSGTKTPIVKNELFDLNFLQNFSFSPTFSLKNPLSQPAKTKNNFSYMQQQNGFSDFTGLEESLIPADQLLQIFFGKEDGEKPSSNRVHVSSPSIL